MFSKRRMTKGTESNTDKIEKIKRALEEAEAVSPPMQRNILGELPVRATNTILQRCRFLTRKERKRSQGIKDFEKIKAF